ncbi:MAG: hypothetical protein ACE141_14465 [Bryobacteraceae bacterium]
MTLKSPVIFLSFLISPCFAQALPNGLDLVRFEVRTPQPALVGANVSVEITLKNLSGSPMRFDPEFGIFVGARANSTSNDNNRDFGHAQKGLVLGPDRQVTIRASRQLDVAGTWRFWPAFRLNGQWGPFRWMEKTVEVYATAAEARAQGGSGPAAGTVTVAEIAANPSRYDGKRVTVVGDALVVRQQTDRNSGPWALISMVDIDNRRAVINVIGAGRAPVVNGDVMRATGVFRAKNKRGRYTYDNELICPAGGIVKDQKQSAQKLADEMSDTTSFIEIRKVVGRKFNPALLQGRLAGKGSEVKLEFQTRTYSQRPRRNTVTGAGRGVAAIRLESVERRHQITGHPSPTAGEGNEWMVVRVWLRGSASNRGEPETFAQSFVYRDPPPAFFVTDREGAVYYPDGIWLNPVNYPNKGDFTTGDIKLGSSGWSRTSLPFKVPRGIQQPVLVILTWRGGNSYQYAGIRLY